MNGEKQSCFIAEKASFLKQNSQENVNTSEKSASEAVLSSRQEFLKRLDVKEVTKSNEFLEMGFRAETRINETQHFLNAFHDESSTRGTAGLLKRLKERGELAAFLVPTNAVESKLKPFDLKYYDTEGNLLTAKQAYKELSHKFHGTRIGKRKIQKKLMKRFKECLPPEEDNNDKVMREHGLKIAPISLREGIFGMKK